MTTVQDINMTTSSNDILGWLKKSGFISIPNVQLLD